MSKVELIIAIVAGLGAILVIGWRFGGSRASRAAREAEFHREVDE